MPETKLSREFMTYFAILESGDWELTSFESRRISGCHHVSIRRLIWEEGAIM